jgi:hypothetical protein
VRATAFVSAHGAFGGHNLQKFQDRRVAEIFFFTQRFVDFANRRRPARPQHAEDFQLRRGWLLQRLFEHGGSLLRRVS